jgi:hypothetical protein
MVLTALQPSAAQIPPDVAAVLGDAPIHPELLLRAPSRPVLPTAASLTKAALAFASLAAAELREPSDLLPLGARGIIHSVGAGGVLHLAPSNAPRAVSLVRGTLAQRGSQRPSLQPGAVRLVPAGHALTLADLTGEGALAVEVLV